MTPKVSIIIPTYNRSHLLKRAITSVLNQQYSDFELIIVNDGSKDDSRKKVEEFRDKRILYIEQEHMGAAAAENKGIKASRGSYLAFIDDDDEWMPEKLQIQMKVFVGEPTKTGVLYCGANHIDLESGALKYHPDIAMESGSGDVHKLFFSRNNFVSLVTAIVRKECFDKVGGFDESLPSGNDRDLWIRISQYYFFKYLPLSLVKIHQTPKSVSRTESNIIETHKILLERYRKEYLQYGKKRYAYLMCRVGNSYVLNGNIAKGVQYLRKAVRECYEDPIHLIKCIGRTFYYGTKMLKKQ
jgi:glycosyltransferase involved in cell wall biosynthesis